MKLTELIKELQETYEERGECDVCIKDRKGAIFHTYIDFGEERILFNVGD